MIFEYVITSLAFLVGCLVGLKLNDWVSDIERKEEYNYWEDKYYDLMDNYNNLTKKVDQLKEKYGPTYNIKVVHKDLQNKEIEDVLKNMHSQTVSNGYMVIRYGDGEHQAYKEENIIRVNKYKVKS